MVFPRFSHVFDPRSSGLEGVVGDLLEGEGDIRTCRLEMHKRLTAMNIIFGTGINNNNNNKM